MLNLAFLLIAIVPSPQEGRSFILDHEGRRIQLTERELPPRWQECHLCHPAKQKEFIHKKTTTLIEHKSIRVMHGRFEIMCQHCHDVNFYNYLRSTEVGPASFENSSGVCQRCHADRYKDWREGIHGKRVGSWNEGIIQFQCIDCHSPHDVKFKKMEASPAPVKSRFLFKPRTEHHD